MDQRVFSILTELECILEVASKLDIDAFEDERERKALMLLLHAYEIVKELKSRDKLRSILF